MAEAKKRILHCSEATFLSTGFSTYSLEVLKRLHATGKYELAEFASYGPPGDERALDLPWRYYPNLPAPNDPTEVERYRSRVTNQFGEWKFEEVCNDFRPDVVVDCRDPYMFEYQERSPFRPYFHHCFVAGTPVMMADGSGVNIENIRPGDQIVNGNGNVCVVKKIAARASTDGLVRIKSAGWGIETLCTPDHRWFVIRNRGRVRNPAKKRYYQNSVIYDSSQWREVTAGDIRAGDMVITPVLPAVAGATPPRVYSEDLATLIGFFITEGTGHRDGTISFCFHTDEQEYIKEVRHAILSLLPGQHVFSRRSKNSLAHNTGFHSKKWLLEVFSSCYDKQKAKIIPSWVFHAPEWFVRRVIRCMWNGDGCVTRNSHGYSGFEYFTKSRSLALSLWQLLLRLGVVTNVTFRLYHGHTGYRFFVYGEDAARLSKIVDKRHAVGKPTIPLMFAKIAKKRAWLDAHNRLVSRVLSVTRLETESVVYDLEVVPAGEPDAVLPANSFCVPSAVHNCLMPTVDSYPQEDAWLATFAQADGVFAYSDWGAGVLRDQGIPAISSAPPGADLETLGPVPDKKAHKRELGLPEDSLVVGTVMRNQPRKLYPDLIAAFGRLLREAPPELARRSFLYLHACYPDLGWDLPRLVKEAGIASHTLWTYICKSCGMSFPSFYLDADAHCRACGQKAAVLPNTQIGVPRYVLAKVLNFFDVYVQYASREGFGMPMVEAACCQVPVVAVDFSAMSDVVRKLGGTPVRPVALIREPGMNCFRAVPDENDFLKKLIDVLSMPEGLRLKKGFDARQAVLRHYTYDRTAKIWEDYFDGLRLRPQAETWGSPLKQHRPPAGVPKGLTTEQFVRWGIVNLAGRADLLGGYLPLRMARDLTWRVTVGHLPRSVFNEMSLLGTTYTPVDYLPYRLPEGKYGPNVRFAAEELLEMAEHRNHWERERVLANNRKEKS